MPYSTATRMQSGDTCGGDSDVVGNVSEVHNNQRDSKWLDIMEMVKETTAIVMMSLHIMQSMM